MPSILEWLSQIDTTPPPSAPLETEDLPQISEIPPTTSPFRPKPSSHAFPSSARPRKTLLTSLSAKRTKEAEIHFAHRASQLARATRETSAALLEYRLLRTHEINIMLAMAQEECNAAATLNEDVAHHQSHIQKLDAIRAIALEEYQEALVLLKSAELDVKNAAGALVSMGEQIPPASSQPRCGSQMLSENLSSRSTSPCSDSDSTV